MPSKLRRRAISWPILHIAFVLIVVLALPALAVLVVVDLVRGRWNLNLTRVYALAAGMISLELFWLWIGTLSFVFTLGGRLLPDHGWTALNFWFQNQWLGGQVIVARLTCGFRMEVQNPEVAHEANAIVMARHLSHADALFPAMVYGVMAGHELRYLLKQELQWIPAMDLVGNRLPHVWVDRAPGPNSPMLAVMEAIAAEIDDHTVACLFPEGTFFTPNQLKRALDRLERTRPDLAAEARGLRHVLPPRPAGSLALLEGAPSADVVVLGHIGLEAYSNISDIVRAVPVPQPVKVTLWRHPRSEIPDEPPDQAAWLVHRWIELDDWIDAQLSTRPPAATGRRNPAA